MNLKNLALFLLFPLLFIACSKKKAADPGPSQLQQEVTNIDKTLASDTSDHIIKDATGVRIAVKSFGNGPFLYSGETIKLKYTGRLFSNPSIIVDTGTYNGLLNNITIQGLGIGVPNLTAGSLASIYVPSQYGYGSKGTSTIPGNSTLIYDVTLVSIIMTSSEQTQFNLDTAAIHKYLTHKNITNAKQLSYGIWYTLDSVGSGAKAQPYYNINCHYAVTVLTDSTNKSSGTLSNQSLLGVIDGFRIGMVSINAGSKATFYIPSGLAYGTNSQGTIPSNASLIFEVKLQSSTK